MALAVAAPVQSSGRRWMRRLSRWHRAILLTVVRFFRCGAKCLGYLLICTFFSLVTVVTYTFFFDFVPRLIPLVGHVGGALLSMLGTTFLSLALVNYLTLICGSPGVAPRPRLGADDDVEALNAPGAGGDGGGMKTCRYCRALQPERAVHCTICDCCVLKMDHHCPWINNCVGYKNQRFFLNFLLWLSAACTLVASSGVPLVVYGSSYSEEDDRIVMSFLVSVAVGLCMYAFCVWNWFLCLTNQTVIEFNEWLWHRQKSRFNRGAAHNLWTVFGTKNIFRAVLPSWAPLPLCDGVNSDDVKLDS